MLADVQTRKGRFSGRRDDKIAANNGMQVETAKRADLLDLAGRYTVLRRESGHEWAGPCPKCGAESPDVSF